MSIEAPIKTISNGLVLHLDAANTKSYPGSGTSWRDLSSNGNNGTTSGTPTFSSANGGTIVFDGTDDYVNTNKLPSELSVYDQDYTFSAWVYPTNLSSDKTIFGTDQTTFRTGLHLIFRSGAIYQGHYSSDFSAGTVSINNWYNIVYTFVKSSGLATIYKNGVSQGSGTISSFLGTSNVFIGRWANGNYFVGNGAMYSIWNRPLSATEIRQNYDASKSRFGL